jgi:hypothetical protein
VATERQLADFSVGMCVARIEESAPSLRAVLLRAANGEVLPNEERLPSFRERSPVNRSRFKRAGQETPGVMWRATIRVLARAQEGQEMLSCQ